MGDNLSFKTKTGSNPKGRVYWLTGLSGVGKTTVAKSMVKLLKAYDIPTIHLDGDSLREVLGAVGQYSVEDRHKLASIYVRMCKLLSDQGYTVVCSTISLFEDVRQWGRSHIPIYFVINIRANSVNLKKWDPASKFNSEKCEVIDEIVGIDIPAEIPIDAELLVENDRSKTPKVLAKFILDRIG